MQLKRSCRAIQVVKKNLNSCLLGGQLVVKTIFTLPFVSISAGTVPDIKLAQSRKGPEGRPHVGATCSGVAPDGCCKFAVPCEVQSHSLKTAPSRLKSSTHNSKAEMLESLCVEVICRMSMRCNSGVLSDWAV